MRTVTLGDVLTRVERSEDVAPNRAYPMLGVRSFARGAFKANDLLGASTAYRQLRRVRAGDVVYPKLMAWEGAFAVVPRDLDGHFVSPEFCTFEIDRTMVMERYIKHLLSWSDFSKAIAGSSTGTNARRRRLQPADFLRSKFQLPDREQQKAVVARLESIIEAVVLARESNLLAAAKLLDRVEGDMIRQAMETNRRPLVDLVEVNPRHGDIPDLVHFIPMADVDEHAGVIKGQQLIHRGDLTPGLKRISTGDIIFARITPSMQNGKTAIFDGLLSEAGFGSTEFHVLRPRRSEFARPLHAILRSRWFRDRAMAHFTGTAGQQRVPAFFLEEVCVPDISTAQSESLVARLREIDEQRRKLLRLRNQRTALSEALPQAARSDVFSNLA